MEAVSFLEALVRALGRGWSARYGVIAPFGVLGVTLTSDTGGKVEVVPSLVRGPAVIWSPFMFTVGEPHYDLHADGQLTRTAVLADAVAHLEHWRRARGPAGKVAARLARVGARRRPVRITEVERSEMGGGDPAGFAGGAGGKAARGIERSEMGGGDPAGSAGGAGGKAARGIDAPRSAPHESLADALRGKPLGEIKRARELAAERDRDVAAGELLAIARRSTGDARANALGVLVAIARPEHGPELARYLSDVERSVQRIAIDGVKRTGYAAAVPALAQLVLARDGKPTSPRTRLATEAATAMKVLSGQRGAAALTGYFSSDDPRVREAACVAFTLFTNPGTKQARPALERLLTDGDPRVVRAARRALAPR